MIPGTMILLLLLCQVPIYLVLMDRGDLQTKNEASPSILLSVLRVPTRYSHAPGVCFLLTCILAVFMHITHKYKCVGTLRSETIRCSQAALAYYRSTAVHDAWYMTYLVADQRQLLLASPADANRPHGQLTPGERSVSMTQLYHSTKYPHTAVPGIIRDAGYNSVWKCKERWRIKMTTKGSLYFRPSGVTHPPVYFELCTRVSHHNHTWYIEDIWYRIPQFTFCFASVFFFFSL